MRTALAAASSLALLCTLTACSVAEAQDPVAPPGGSGEQQPDALDEDCLIGRWSLDTEDYRGQAEGYLKSLSIPIEGLAVTGTQILTFESGGEEANVGLSTDLTWTGSLMGHGIVAPDQSSGGGVWDASSMEPARLVVDTWLWGVEPHVAPGDAPTIPSLGLADSGPIDVACTATTLELHGVDAILTGRFVRID